MNKTITWLQHFLLYAKAMLKWLVISVVVGIFCGLLGSAFHYGVSTVNMIRELNPRVIWLLPLGGLLAVGIYKQKGREPITFCRKFKTEKVSRST